MRYYASTDTMTENAIRVKTQQDLFEFAVGVRFADKIS